MKTRVVVVNNFTHGRDSFPLASETIEFDVPAETVKAIEQAMAGVMKDIPFEHLLVQILLVDKNGQPIPGQNNAG